MTLADQWTCVAGDLSNLTLRRGVDIGPLPDQPNFATVRVRFVGLNFADVFSCLGLYSATPEGEFVPGLEFSGVIERVSEGTNSFNVGDEVFGVKKFGAYSTYLHVNLAYTRKLPEGWSL